MDEKQQQEQRQCTVATHAMRSCLLCFLSLVTSIANLSIATCLLLILLLLHLRAAIRQLLSKERKRERADDNDDQKSAVSEPFLFLLDPLKSIRRTTTITYLQQLTISKCCATLYKCHCRDQITDASKIYPTTFIKMSELSSSSSGGGGGSGRL